ncbi:hypothetical protein ABT404_30975, partial [Streptomyces hyaluromycini]
MIPSSNWCAADAGLAGAVGVADGAGGDALADALADRVGAGRSLASTVGLGPAGLVVVLPPPSAYAPTGTAARAA